LLIAESTKYCAGIKIFGDYLDLKNFHETIHYLVEGVAIGGHESTLGEFVLGLAYDVRHAYQRDREIQEFGSFEHDSVTYMGFSTLWPYILPQVGLLRNAAAFYPTNRNHQSTLFKIESCIEETLYSIDPIIGKDVFGWLTSFSGLSSDYYIEFINQCAFRYVTEKKTAKARFRLLPGILHTMAPWGEEYRNFASNIESIAKENGCSPHKLTDVEEWPEFKW